MTNKTAQDLLEEAKQEARMISCEAFKKLEKEEADYTLLDVREKEETDEGHIEGALLIPRGVLEFQAAEKLPNKDARIIICCKSGGRATLAAETLKEMGYTHVAVLEGGYTGYCAKG